jgi:hypothetical protein
MMPLAMTTIDEREKPCDRAALLMMLAYVEAECRRIGSDAAADHAAMAAALIQGPAATVRMDGLPLH